VKFYRVARWFVLGGLLLAVILMLRKPAPIAQPMSRAALAQNAGSFREKLSELAQKQARGESDAEVRLTAGEVAAAISEVSGTPAPSADGTPPGADDSDASRQPASNAYQVVFEGDVARGQFATSFKGKQMYITIAGHLGATDGYVTFNPTELKLGSLPVPVAMVNGRLQQKLLEQRERLKLPGFITGLRVEGGQLVVREE
jgi:hypothetical protein